MAKGFNITNQKVSIHLSLNGKIRGFTELTIVPTTPLLKTIWLHARELVIHSTSLKLPHQSSVPLAFSHLPPAKPALTEPDNAHTYPELKRAIWKAANEGEEGELGIAVPASALRRVPSHPDPRTGATPAATPRERDRERDKDLEEYEPLTVAIEYSVQRPGEGIVVVQPDEANPSRFPHVFTSASSDIAARTWVPCWDYARERCTWELEFIAPRVLYSTSKPPTDHTQSGMDFDGVDEREEEDDEDDEEDDGVRGAGEEEWPLTVVASGELIEQVVHPDRSDRVIWHYSQATPISVQQVAWAIGPFVVMEIAKAVPEDQDGEQADGEDGDEAEDDGAQEEGYKLHALCLPGREAEMAHGVGVVRQAMEYYQSTIGSYPYSTYKLAFVDSLASGSPTFHSAALTLFSSDILHPPSIIDQAYEARQLLAHALAMQWAGVNLIPAKAGDTWLVVGIALHVTGQFLRKLWGNNEYRFRIKKDMLRCVGQDIQRPPIAENTLGTPDAQQMQFIALKAPLVLYILDKYLRKSGTSLGLDKVLPKIFLDAYSNTDFGPTNLASWNTLSTDKFSKICSKACGASRDGLRVFFDQWVYGSGCPTFKVQANFNRKRMAIELNVQQECLAYSWADQDPRNDGPNRQPWHEISHLRPVALFEGQMTIRIHEADGTPYEHVLAINEPFKRHEVPFNTKYKRVRRNTKRYQARQAAATAAAAGDTDAQEDMAALDVGFNNYPPWEDERERERWRVEDWTEEDDAAMSSATYEWIRIDADLEWICHVQFEQKDFMWLSQLTRDRDVVAQLEAVHALSRVPTKIVTSNLAKTVLTNTYFVRIRMEACLALLACVGPQFDHLGLFYLLKIFQSSFCFEPEREEKDPFKFRCIPKTNDFSDIPDYLLKKTLVTALGLVRDERGQTPKVVLQLLVDLLAYNDNLGNKFADTFYLTTIIHALAHAFVSTVPREYSAFADDDHLAQDAAQTAYLPEALEQLERYMSTDKLVPSFHNALTVAGTEFHIKLMLASLIPTDFAHFFALTRDGNYPPVRLAAFDAILLLGPFDVNRHQKLGIALVDYLCRVMADDSSLLVRRRVAESALESLPVLIAMQELASPAQREMQENNRSLKKANKGAKQKGNQDEDQDLESQLLRSLRTVPGRSKNTRAAILNVLTHPDVDTQVQLCLIKILELTLKPGPEPIPKTRLKLTTSSASVAHTPLSITIPRSAGPATPAVIEDADFSADWGEPASARAGSKKAKQPKPAKVHAAGRSGLSRPDEVATSRLLEKLKKNKNAIYFLAPVDPVQSGAVNYYDIIKQPMDLGTMQAKLAGGMYANRNEIKLDFKQIVANAAAYNIEGPVVDQALALDSAFDKAWKRMESTLDKMSVDGFAAAQSVPVQLTQRKQPPPVPTWNDEPAAKPVSFKVSLPHSQPPTPSAEQLPTPTFGGAATGGFKLKLGGAPVSASPTPTPAPEPAPVPAGYYDPFGGMAAAGRLAGPAPVVQSPASYSYENSPAPQQHEFHPEPMAPPPVKLKLKQPARLSLDEQDYGAPPSRKPSSKQGTPVDGVAGHKKKAKKVNYAEPADDDDGAFEEQPLAAYVDPLAPARPAVLDLPELPRPESYFDPNAPIDPTRARPVLLKVLGMTESYFYREQVDPNLLPTYHLEIQNPIWLRRMLDKLDQGVYASYGQLFADMDLLVANCRQFNTPNTEPIWMCLVMERAWRAEWEKASKMAYHTKRALEGFLKKLMKEGCALFFNEPVDTSVIPDYNLYIPRDNMRDLGSILKGIAKDSYQSLEQVDDDVRLMLANCYAYNPPGNQVRLSGEELERKWESGLQKVRAELSKKRQGSEKAGGPSKKAKY